MSEHVNPSAWSTTRSKRFSGRRSTSWECWCVDQRSNDPRQPFVTFLVDDDANEARQVEKLIETVRKQDRTKSPKTKKRKIKKLSSSSWVFPGSPVPILFEKLHPVPSFWNLSNSANPTSLPQISNHAGLHFLSIPWLSFFGRNGEFCVFSLPSVINYKGEYILMNFEKKSEVVGWKFYENRVKKFGGDS